MNDRRRWLAQFVVRQTTSNEGGLRWLCTAGGERGGAVARLQLDEEVDEDEDDDGDDHAPAW